MADSDSIKLCECGCGRPAPIAADTDKTRDYKKGRPRRFISGHNLAQHGHRRRAGSSTNPPSGARRRVGTSLTYGVWRGMLDRCRNTNSPAWRLYGGRGITVCDRWRKFENFLSDMGEKPPGMSLDRIDNNGSYEPSNCRWADQETQCNNKRTNHLVTAFGKTQTLVRWSREIGVGKATLRRRLRAGWSPERAISTPVLSYSEVALLRWRS